MIVYLCNKILFCFRKENTVDKNDGMNESQELYVDKKYTALYMKYQDMQN